MPRRVAHRNDVINQCFLKLGGRIVIIDVSQGSLVGLFLNGFIDEWNNAGHQGDFLTDLDNQRITQVGFTTPLISQPSYDWAAENDIAMYGFMLNLFGLDKQ